MICITLHPVGAAQLSPDKALLSRGNAQPA
jgi:hypothetical protein